jgi:hypothetical protein
MIDRGHNLSLARQAELLGLNLGRFRRPSL